MWRTVCADAVAHEHHVWGDRGKRAAAAGGQLARAAAVPRVGARAGVTGATPCAAAGRGQQEGGGGRGQHRRQRTAARPFSLATSRRAPCWQYWAPVLPSTHLTWLPRQPASPLLAMSCTRTCPWRKLRHRQPLLHTRGIARGRSFGLEVAPWAPTRLASRISHTGPEESSGASTLPPGPAQPPSASNFP